MRRTKFSGIFEIQTDHSISTRRLSRVLIENKKRTCHQVNLIVPANHRVKMKKKEKIDKYLDLARELKMPWNMRVTVIPIIVSALEALLSGLKKILVELKIKWRSKTQQTTALLKSTKILKRAQNLRRPTVTQILVKKHQLMQVWGICKVYNNNNNDDEKKKICKIVDFAVPVDHRIKLKECEKRDKYFDLARELKKKMEHEGDNYTNCDWCFWHGN